MESSSTFLMVASLILVLFPILKTSFAYSGVGFMAELIHRDSPLSPLYNPSTTQYDRLTDALNRSISRQIFLRDATANKRSIRSHVLSYGSEYLMKVKMGTPPVTLFLVVDTGSVVNWAKCIPCNNCSTKGRHIYNPKLSQTYRPVSCKSSACRALDRYQALPCGKRKNGCVDNSCPYVLVYGDGSISKGNLAIETIALESNLVNGFIFGCSHEVHGDFPGSGIVGLGIGNLSMIKQLGNSTRARFSYCFSTNKSTSKISFGDESIPISDPEMVSTPMVIEGNYSSYYLTLRGFTSANGSWIQFDKEIKEGNIIIDSGSSYTMLPSSILQELEQTYMQRIRAKRVDDPKKISNLCFETSSVSKFPSIVAHFDGGANLVLSPMNTFVSTSKGVFCLNVVTTFFSVPIFGNLWQQNILVGYDLEKKRVYFKPGCPHY